MGLVFVAAATADGEEVRQLRLGYGNRDDREIIRYAASSHALNLLIRTLRPGPPSLE